MKRFGLVAIAAILVAGEAEGQTSKLERATPESQGVPSEAVIGWFDSLMKVDATEIHGAMLLRHGKVIGEMHPKPFRAEYGHTLFSCSKVFTAAAIGIAVGENRLRVSDRVATFFPELLPDSIGDWLAKLTIRDLLTMQSGYAPTDEVRTKETEWVKKCLGGKMVAQPGEKFAYDSMNTYLLSAIISKVTGKKMVDYLRPRLFEPMGIDEEIWEESPEGISCGGWGLYLKLESMAKMGQLLLDEGRWEGRQILPAEWAREMMTVHVEKEGYGYQTWRCEHHGTMRGDGAHGQFIIVMPDEDMVAVITQCCNTLPPGIEERRLLFEGLLPTLSATPIKEGKGAGKLAKREAEYALPTAEGRATSKKQNLKLGKEMRLEKNKMGWETMTARMEGGDLCLEVTTARGDRETMRCGNGEWRESKVGTHFPPNSRGTTLGAFSNFDVPFTACGSYGWSGNGELMVKIIFADWMSAMTIKMDINEEKPEFKISLNIDTKPFTIATK